MVIADPNAIDIGQMLLDEYAYAEHTPFDIGRIADVFDGNTVTLARTPGINPAQITIVFDEPQTIAGSSVYLSHTWGDPAYCWSLEVADNLADMNGQTGSWQLLVADLGTATGTYSTVMLETPGVAQVARLTVQRLTGDDYVHVNEWTLIGPRNPEDSDGDGLPDTWEVIHFSDLNHDGTADDDQDGLTNLEEFYRSTDPNVTDTDGDDVSDGTETVYGTNPLHADSAPSLLSVFVAFDYAGVPETGSASAPFNTMEEAFGVCAAGAAMRIDGTATITESTWTGRIEAPLTLHADGGPVRIGVLGEGAAPLGHLQ